MTETDAAPLSVHDKSFPADAAGLTVDAFLATEPALADFSTPLFALAAEPLAHNITTIARWAVQQGAELMPHGKTTMAPSLWHRQLDAGATGITVATGWQARVALHEGVETVQIANECLDPGSLRAISAHLRENPRTQVLAWADSVSTIARMEEVLGEVAEPSRIGILVELGAAGARTGARSATTAREVVAAVRASGSLRLVGVAGYEGHSRTIARRRRCGRWVPTWRSSPPSPSRSPRRSPGTAHRLGRWQRLPRSRRRTSRVVPRSGAARGGALGRLPHARRRLLRGHLAAQRRQRSRPGLLPAIGDGRIRAHHLDARARSGPVRCGQARLPLR
ncbi:alanine racemase [Microbacterium sp. NIBRBAC000506063]|uniref:alanine racemase n=1 Tax=Microbacterium sp. NIBRBAC000506063 TaxID=2734618 RepID=UPI001CB71845|nr:alanine racemase [Microbacterium sp. NIBRBAC000506063]